MCGYANVVLRKWGIPPDYQLIDTDMKFQFIRLVVLIAILVVSANTLFADALTPEKVYKSGITNTYTHR
jgi:hypothetical protein